MLPPIEPEFLANLPGGSQIFIQRLDKIAGPLSGNKWFKLKYNLEQAQQLKSKGLLTFGGAYSNHIYATAAAGHQINVPTVGLIRGEIIEPLNPTLRQARKWGMHLEAMSRSDYRQKNSTEIMAALSQKYPGYYLIPEGGSNALAVKGCGEILVPGYHYWCVSCGTGGTLAGMIHSETEARQILGFPALKGADFLYDDIKQLLDGQKVNQEWELSQEFHFGGYARFTEELLEFMRKFKQTWGIELDPIYTGKLFYGVFNLASRGFFPEQSKIVIVHSGGLQGNKGFREKYGKNVF